jgi:hypothetical protein
VQTTADKDYCTDNRKSEKDKENLIEILLLIESKQIHLSFLYTRVRQLEVTAMEDAEM